VKVKIKKGDTVEVISGRYDDKGRRGEVIKMLPKNGRVTVQGVSMRKKHQSQVQTQGFQRDDEGTSQRVCKKCSALFD